MRLTDTDEKVSLIAELHVYSNIPGEREKVQNSTCL